MANLTPTNLLLGFSKVTEKFNAPEFRMPNTAALSTAYLGAMTQNPMDSLRTREDRATWFDFGITKADEGKTERLHDHSGARMDSLRKQLTWGTVVDTFSISEKQLDNNSFSYDEVFAKSILNSVQKNLVKWDNAFMALLKADMTQINVGGLGDLGTWNAVDNVYELSADQKDYVLALIEANLQNNDFNEQLIALVDSVGYINAAKTLAQGAGNSVNLAYQAGNTSLVKTNKTVFSGYNGSAIVFPANHVGIIPWIPKQNRKALDVEKAMTYNGDKGSISIPVHDQNGNVAYTIDAAISMYSQRADTSGANGNKQDILSQVEISWDYAYMSAPLSTARATGDFAGKTDSVVYGFGLKSV